MKSNRKEKFIELYTPHHDAFERFCRARVYGEMEHSDLINETLLVTFEKLDSIRNEEAFFSFICRTALNILSKKHRRQKFIGKDDRKVVTTLDFDSTPDEKADVQFLYQAISELNELEQNAILLFEIAGFSIKEIAKIEASSESAIKQRLRRGREKLRKILTLDLTSKKQQL